MHLRLSGSGIIRLTFILQDRRKLANKTGVTIEVEIDPARRKSTQIVAAAQNQTRTRTQETSEAPSSPNRLLPSSPLEGQTMKPLDNFCA